jgi:hypothetical protein
MQERLKLRSQGELIQTEAFRDWYLIGESDVVVSNYMSPSFGETAATRTIRPY